MIIIALYKCIITFRIINNVGNLCEEVDFIFIINIYGIILLFRWIRAKNSQVGRRLCITDLDISFCFLRYLWETMSGYEKAYDFLTIDNIVWFFQSINKLWFYMNDFDWQRSIYDADIFAFLIHSIDRIDLYMSGLMIRNSVTVSA